MTTTLAKFLTILTLLVAAAGFSFAGPMMEKNVAPAPMPECDWTGLYIGINVGVGQLDSTFTDRNGWDDYYTREFTQTAFIGGGQIGYNYQWQDLVFGIEADATGSTADINRRSHEGGETGEGSSAGEPYGFKDRAQIDFMGSVRGRLGISFNNNRALLYATAGGAFANGKWQTENTGFPGDEVKWDGEDWRWGWVGGFGFEYALNCHWSLRGEGLYYWFGEDTTNVDFFGSHYSTSERIAYRGYQYTFSDSFWTYRVGLNYKFSGFFGGH